jgi:hypothetical protein
MRFAATKSSSTATSTGPADFGPCALADMLLQPMNVASNNPAVSNGFDIVFLFAEVIC